MLKLIQKYWFYISLIFTLLSSLATGGWYLKGKIDAQADTITDLNKWIQDHDDAIQTLHDDTLKLKEDERLRETGLLQK